MFAEFAAVLVDVTEGSVLDRDEPWTLGLAVALTRHMDGERPEPEGWTALMLALASVESETAGELGALFQPVLDQAASEGRLVTAADALALRKSISTVANEQFAEIGEEVAQLASSIWSPGMTMDEAIASARLIINEHHS